MDFNLSHEEKFYWRMLTPSNTKESERKMIKTAKKSTKKVKVSSVTTAPIENSNRRSSDLENRQKNKCRPSSVEKYKHHEQLFNKSQKRISHLNVGIGESSKDSTQKNDVMEHIFKQMDEPNVFKASKEAVSIPDNLPTRKSKRRTNLSFSKKGPLYSKVQAETLNMFKNRQGSIRQRAHMNTSLKKPVFENEISTNKVKKLSNGPVSRSPNVSISKPTKKLISKPEKVVLKQPKAKKPKKNTTDNLILSDFNDASTSQTIKEPKGNSLQDYTIPKKKTSGQNQEISKNLSITKRENKQVKSKKGKSLVSKLMSKSKSFSEKSTAPVSSSKINRKKLKNSQFKRVSLFSDDSDDEEIRRPPTQKARRIVSDSEESDVESLSQVEKFISTNVNCNFENTNETSDFENINKTSDFENTNETYNSESTRENSPFHANVESEDRVFSEPTDLFNEASCSSEVNFSAQGTSFSERNDNPSSKETNLSYQKSSQHELLTENSGQISHLEGNSKISNPDSNKCPEVIELLSDDEDDEDDDIMIIGVIENSQINNNSTLTNPNGLLFNYSNTQNLGVEDLFRRNESDTRMKELSRGIMDLLATSNNESAKLEQLVQKITHLPASIPVCCCCSSSSKMNCQSCNRPLCGFICKMDHRCEKV